MERAKAVASGVLKFGGIDVDCYVLEDGRRVISARGIQQGIGAAGSKNLPRLVRRLPPRFSHLNEAPVLEFTIQTGGAGIVANGYDRNFFVDLCDAYADTFAAGELHVQQEGIARTCIAVIRSLAKVGIDALIDEATGYQKVRANDYLQRLFEHSLREEATKWQLTFPKSLARALAPLWGVSYTDGPHPRELQRAYGQIYNFVLGDDVAAELRRKNADTKDSLNHHQWLTPPARALLADDLRVVEMLASQSGTKREFWGRMRSHYRKEPLQLGLVEHHAA